MVVSFDLAPVNLDPGAYILEPVSFRLDSAPIPLDRFLFVSIPHLYPWAGFFSSHPRHLYPWAGFFGGCALPKALL